MSIRVFMLNALRMPGENFMGDVGHRCAYFSYGEGFNYSFIPVARICLPEHFPFAPEGFLTAIQAEKP